MFSPSATRRTSTRQTDVPRSAAITGALQTNAGRARDVPSPPANQVVLYWSIEGDREQ